MALYGCSPKITAIIAGLFTLFQALIWSILGIVSLLIYSCTIYSSSETLAAYRFYLIYLYNGQCGSVEIEAETENGTVTLTWPETGVRTADRNRAWIIVYLIFSLCWIIASLLLLIATISDTKGSKGVKLRGPWLIITSIFLILDVITSVIYSIDISNTSDLVKLLKFVGVVIPEEINSYSTTLIFGNFTMISSIIAIIIFSRGIFGWALNLAMLVHVAQDTRTRETSSPLATVRPEPRQPYQEYLRKLSTVGPVPDVKWDPYQRKRSDLPVIKPLKEISPPNERRRKQSDYQQYLFYAKQSPQLNYLDDIISEPPTPSIIDAGSTTTGIWRNSTPQATIQNNSKKTEIQNEYPPVPVPDYESEFPDTTINFQSLTQQGSSKNEARY